MGGEAAKERRRLKRLESQDKSDGTAAPSGQKPNYKKSDGDAPKNQTKEGSSSTELQLRIQRKMARKASGQFKANPPAQIPKNPKLPTPTYRRKSDDDGNNRKEPHHPSKNAFNRSPNDNFSRNNTSFNGKTNTRFKDFKNKPPAKKNNTIKPKVKKPKHLKRKMDQLSQTIAEGEGNSISDLEDQMKQLAEKMEELKKLKQKQSVVVESS